MMWNDFTGKNFRSGGMIEDHGLDNKGLFEKISNHILKSLPAVGRCVIKRAFNNCSELL
jgi:hypothetical protein